MLGCPSLIDSYILLLPERRISDENLYLVRGEDANTLTYFKREKRTLNIRRKDASVYEPRSKIPS